MDSSFLFYYYFRGSRKSPESGDVREKETTTKSGIYTHLCLQNLSLKGKHPVNIFYIPQNLKVWHTTVKMSGCFADLWGFLGSLKLWIWNTDREIHWEVCRDPGSEWEAWMNRMCDLCWEPNTARIPLPYFIFLIKMKTYIHILQINILKYTCTCNTV